MYFRVYAGNIFCGHLSVTRNPQTHCFTSFINRPNLLSRHGGVIVSYQPIKRLFDYKQLNLKRTDRPRLSI